MTKRRLFIGKAMRPDITKPISDRVYRAECGPFSGQDQEDLTPYPGVSLKGCSKDGSDGKEGSDGQESLPDFVMDEDTLPPFVDLGVRFTPQLIGAGAGPPLKITIGKKQ